MPEQFKILGDPESVAPTGESIDWINDLGRGR